MAQAALADTAPVEAAHGAVHESKHAFYSILDSIKENTLAKGASPSLSFSPSLRRSPRLTPSPCADAVGIIQTGAGQVAALDDRKFLLEEVRPSPTSLGSS